MQAVYKDGSLGQEISVEDKQEFLNKLKALTEQANVDHVRVFEKVDGKNQVGIPQIEDKILDEKINSIIEKKIDEALERKKIMEEFAILPFK